MNKKELVYQLKKGSITAFDALYRQYSGKLYNFIMSISNKDEYLSEEIVQQAFIKIWEVREQIDPEKSFIAFLFTISRNMLMNSYQRRTIEYIYKGFVQKEFNDGHSETEQEIEYNLLNELVDSIIEKLPEGRRKVYKLSKKKYLKNKEIAEILQISESTVEKQLASAIKFVREELIKYYDKILLIIFTFIMLK